MITFKGPAEFARMRRAGRVVAEVLAKVAEAARPGVTLLSLERLAAEIITERKCLPSFLNYHG
ncbi:MAG TPA: type I methionyl aminopeptidase, partial [Acidimicrobiia bacterium]|nr:type I methionyl aminopeptidase [Acidimicrobiia bacterium]